MAYRNRVRHTCYLPRFRAGTGINRQSNHPEAVDLNALKAFQTFTSTAMCCVKLPDFARGNFGSVYCFDVNCPHQRGFMEALCHSSGGTVPWQVGCFALRFLVTGSFSVGLFKTCARQAQ